MQKINLTGQTFGRLTVEQQAPNVGKFVTWQCRCVCGEIVMVRAGHLRSGSTLSCGCLRDDTTSAARTTHGMAGTRLYHIWTNIIRRCENPENAAFSYYGGRGISLYDEWRHDFQTFHDYVFQLPHYGEPGYSLDRTNNNGNYEPGNLRWATTTEQHNNQRNVRRITHRGETKTLTEWAHEIGVDVRLIHKRLKLGWSVEKALTQPKRAY